MPEQQQFESVKHLLSLLGSLTFLIIKDRVGLGQNKIIARHSFRDTAQDACKTKENHHEDSKDAIQTSPPSLPDQQQLTLGCSGLLEVMKSECTVYRRFSILPMQGYLNID